MIDRNRLRIELEAQKEMLLTSIRSFPALVLMRDLILQRLIGRRVLRGLWQKVLGRIYQVRTFFQDQGIIILNRKLAKDPK